MYGGFEVFKLYLAIKLHFTTDTYNYEEPKTGYVPADTKYRFEWEGEANLPTYLLPYDPDLND